MSKQGHNSGVSGERLRSFVERIERIEEDIRAAQEDRKEIYSEAKGVGFDTKIICMIVRDRKMSQEQRDEIEALLDLYKAALGMLDGTPLGRSAIDRLQKMQKPSEEESEGEKEQQEQAPQPPTEEEIEKARHEGRSAADRGLPVTRNPYPAHDPRRAAYDEGWCQMAGSDGMEIPDAWKPTKKAKKSDEESKGNGAE